MSVVGTAEVLIVPVTTGFERELKSQTAGGFKTFQKDSEEAGLVAGGSLRGGVSRETGKLASDLEKDGARGGEGLHKGLSGGLSKVSSLLGATGLPLGAFTQGLDRSAGAADHLGGRSESLGSRLDHLGRVALVGVAASAAAAGAAAVDVGMKMQGAEASIAAASGTSVAAASRIGSAFETTAFKSEFSAVDMAKAFSAVAGQLKATEGRALNSAEAMRVMTAADELATAKQIDLGTATSAVAGIMQAFSLKTQDASHVSDVLYKTSVATGQGVDTLANQLEKVRSKLGDAGGSVGDLSALLVDMTNRGITGRAAMGALNTSMNTLQKTATGVQTAVQAQKTAFDGLSPQVQKLAKGYLDGSISSKQFTADTSGLSTQQAALVSQFVSANKAVETAQQKYKNLGVTVFDQHGQFVGMRNIIEQLHGRFADMTQQQQLAAAATLFGAGAARQMVAIIDAGPSAYDKASASVNKLGSAHTAAATQSQTLKVELETLKAGAIDLAAKVGSFLIPIVTSMIGAFTKATSFVLDHKAVLIALGVVVTSILGPAMAVFAVNKMGQFRQSFVDASKNIKQFASDIEGVVHRVVSAFTKQDAAATKMGSTTQAQAAKASTSVKGQATATEASAGKIGAAEGTIASETTAATGTVEGDNAAASGSYARVGGSAGLAATEVGTAETAIAGEVTAADTTIEAANTTAAASFTSLLAVAGKVVGVLAVAKTAADWLANHGVILHQGAPGTGLTGTPTSSLPTPGHPISGGGNIITDITGLFKAKGDKVSSANMFMAGEEGPGHPEYVIATNPAYRGRNLGLWTMAGHDLGVEGFAQGGVPGWSSSQNAVASELMRIFESAGLSAAGAAAIVGNWMQESSLNPSSPGGYLGQWQGSRFTALESYAAAHHESPTSVAAQAGFALQELRQGYGSLLRELRTTNDAARAAVDVSNVYERPATWAANLPNRESSATAARAAFGGSGVVPVHVVKVAPQYVNPLGRATATVGRTDQGKDWSDIKGPIQAIGKGIITQVYSNLSGFGQTVIEKLTSGPKAGQYIYYAMETGGRATISQGAHVKTGQTIGQGLGTGGVEFGFWDPNTGRSKGAPGYHEGDVTAAGTAFASWVAALPRTAAPTATSVGAEVGGRITGPSAAQIAAAQLAAARKRVAQEIVQETKQVDGEIAHIQRTLRYNAVHGGQGGHGDPVSPEHRIKAVGEMAALRAALHLQIEAQKMSVGEHTVVSKAQLAKQTKDLKAGSDAFVLLATAVHSGSMGKLTAALATVHKLHLAKLEENLKGDQGTALAKLSEQLIKVHMEAQRAVAKGQIAAIHESLAPKHMTVLGPDGTFHTVTVHPSALQREQAGVAIAATKASLHLHLQEQRRALGEHTSLSRKEIREQGGELHKGTGIFSSLSAAVQSGNLAKLQQALVAAHDAHLSKLERELHGEHSQALQRLNAELKAVHAQAMHEFVKESAARAAAKAQAASDAKLTQQTTMLGALAQAQASRIADATKVFLDRQAQHGLTGAALTAAKAQTAYDVTVQAADKAINTAQIHVTQAATQSKHAQTIAAAELARAQAHAAIAEARAQSALDKANAKAQGSQGSGGTGTPGTPGPPTVNNHFTIIGEGLDANGVMTEITWDLKTGSLPVRPPLAPVPA